MIAGHADRTVVAQEVRGVEHVDMEGVALDPLARVEQPAKGPHLRLHRHPEEILEGVRGTELVGDGADPADASDDVEDLVGGPPHDELLEVAGCLEDREARLADLAVGDAQLERPLALDAGDPLDLEVVVACLRVSALHQSPPGSLVQPAVRAPLRTEGAPTDPTEPVPFVVPGVTPSSVTRLWNVLEKGSAVSKGAPGDQATGGRSDPRVCRLRHGCHPARRPWDRLAGIVTNVPGAPAAGLRPGRVSSRARSPRIAPRGRRLRDVRHRWWGRRPAAAPRSGVDTPSCKEAGPSARLVDEESKP